MSPCAVPLAGIAHQNAGSERVPSPRAYAMPVIIIVSIADNLGNNALSVDFTISAAVTGQSPLSFIAALRFSN